MHVKLSAVASLLQRLRGVAFTDCNDPCLSFRPADQKPLKVFLKLKLSPQHLLDTKCRLQTRHLFRFVARDMAAQLHYWSDA